MPAAIHRTSLIKLESLDARAVLAKTTDGILSNTRIEVRPGTRGLFIVTIEQIERLPRHKRGLTHSISFVVSRAGLEHLCSVGGRS